jgi:hypothetical protein
MRVDASASNPFPSLRSVSPARANGEDFASLLTQRSVAASDTASDPAASSRPDFTSMTRQELFDWMNGELRSGDMTFDESSVFLGMTMKISAATGEPVDMATDTARIDFTEKARQGLEYHLSRFDDAEAARLQEALDTMQRHQSPDSRRQG